MKEIPEPLMFIHTVTTKKDGKMQEYFDSQDPHEKKVSPAPEQSPAEPEPKESEAEEENKEEDSIGVILESPLPIKDMLNIKINNIIKMYNNGRPVDCIVITDKEVACVPYALEKDELLIKQEEGESRIRLSDIQDIYIVKF